MGKVAGEVARSFVGKHRSSGGKRRKTSDLSRSSEWAGMDVTIGYIAHLMTMTLYIDVAYVGYTMIG